MGSLHGGQIAAVLAEPQEQRTRGVAVTQSFAWKGGLPRVAYGIVDALAVVAVDVMCAKEPRGEHGVVDMFARAVLEDVAEGFDVGAVGRMGVDDVVGASLRVGRTDPAEEVEAVVLRFAGHLADEPDAEYRPQRREYPHEPQQPLHEAQVVGREVLHPESEPVGLRGKIGEHQMRHVGAVEGDVAHRSALQRTGRVEVLADGPGLALPRSRASK